MKKVDRGPIGLATVLLLGILVLASGYCSASRPTLYVRLAITLAGVLVGFRKVAFGLQDPGR